MRRVILKRPQNSTTSSVTDKLLNCEVKNEFFVLLPTGRISSINFDGLLMKRAIYAAVFDGAKRKLNVIRKMGEWF